LHNSLRSRGDFSLDGQNLTNLYATPQQGVKNKTLGKLSDFLYNAMLQFEEFRT